MTDAAHDTHRPAGDGSAGPPGEDPLPRRVPVFAVVGLALLTGAFTTFSFWLLETFPALGSLG